MLKACLNGTRRRDEHPAVPLTPAELAADAVRCAAAGVAAVHVHPRDDAGAESLDPAVIAAAVTAIRASRPGLPVGVSTGAWIVPDPAERVAAVRAWTVLPDFASVNAHEPGAAQVAAALHERGVMVEAGL
ncbi:MULTISPECIES: 3-keto-5-aminohexanoate cleavage protein [unclassified Micromonospora]|uniref:3-keto-5-aminohexanoate cleavage protein n=1 Tax=unclassified Micromonospora TaxID=2617518 RepID=UPI00248D1AED|nr:MULTISPECIES: 3-keto-5-aminohexanoate cleavage protein [unclassified Micromonospora]WBB83307.1 3-keto-5-aminohexanoate cleavage protein [Micromonospora sp. WMMC264]